MMDIFYAVALLPLNHRLKIRKSNAILKVVF